MSVYFARVKGYVKIGYSSSPIDRVATITTGGCLKPADVEYGDPVDLLGWIPGDRKIEAAMHRRFADLFVEGEWYWDIDAYDELIEADPFGVPFHDVSWEVIQCMKEYPHIPRSVVVDVCERVRSENLAIAESPQAQLLAIFGDDWVEELNIRAVAERAADRDHWRSLRSAA